MDRTLNDDINDVDFDELKADVKVINRNAKRLQKLTNDILDVSKIDSHSLKLNITRFNLIKIISSIVKDFTIEGEKRAETISITFFYKLFDGNSNNLKKSL